MSGDRRTELLKSLLIEGEIFYHHSFDYSTSFSYNKFQFLSLISNEKHKFVF